MLIYILSDIVLSLKLTQNNLGAFAPWALTQYPAQAAWVLPRLAGVV